MRKLLTGVATLGLLFFTGACETDLDREDHKLAMSAGVGGMAGNTAGGTKDGVGGISAERKLVRKLQPYIRCINTTAKRVSSSADRYYSWVKDKAKGPTCRERRVSYGTYKLYSTSNCTTALRLANIKRPKLPDLEKAAAGYAKAVSALKPLLDRAYNYYSKRRYKDDGCAQGKALHPKLMAAWKAASGYGNKLRALVAAHNKKLQARFLARVVQRYGKDHPRYFHRKVIADAKIPLGEFKAQLRAKTRDVAKFKTAYKAYQASYNKMNSSTKPSRATGYSTYKMRAKNLDQAFRETIQRWESKKGYSRIERRWLRSSSTAWLVKGSFDRVLKRYNELVNAFNRVRFR